MNTSILVNQSTGISKDEWRLQSRSWGTWLVGLFFLAVVISEHPAWSLADYSAAEEAGFWADRTTLVGSIVAMLTVPFALDRVRRQQVAPIEFSKPFEKIAYIVGKFAGAIMPLVLMVFASLVIHFIITLITAQDAAFFSTISFYLNQSIVLVAPSLLYAAAFCYCLSVYIKRPIIIVPVYLIYLTLTTVTQAAADAQFSWLSPIVRPEYFDGVIPPEWTQVVLLHQGVYFALSIILLAFAAYGFQRSRFLDTKLVGKRRINVSLPRLGWFGIKMRMLWGGHMVAALLMAFIAAANTMSNPETDANLLANYALFGLEFYLPISGLLILAGVLARDKGLGALDLVLTKPVNRWRLLLDRLVPAMTVWVMVCVFSVGFLQLMYEGLPLAKALLTAVTGGLFLGLVGMTVANVTQNALAGYGAGMLYWFFEAGFDGRFTAPFYLFIVSNQVDNSADVWLNPTVWLPVKIGLLFLSGWLFLFNGWLLDAGPKRRWAIILLLISILLLFLLGWWVVPIMVNL